MKWTVIETQLALGIVTPMVTGLFAGGSGVWKWASIYVASAEFLVCECESGP